MLTDSASLRVERLKEVRSGPNSMQQANSHSGKHLKAGSLLLIALGSVLTLFAFFFTSATTDKAFKRGDDRLMQMFDSGVYLNTARTILSIRDEARPHETSENSRAKLKQLAQMLMLDGPIFPTVAAKAIVIGKAFKLAELNALAMLMSFLQALVCGLTFVLCWRATRSKSLAFTAGLIWSLYPPALIGVQRLGTETISALLLLTILLCFSFALSSDRKRLWYLVPMAYAGVFFAFLLLTKPVLMFCVLLPFGFVFLSFKWKPAFLAILAFACATVLTMIPFWVFTKQTTGEACLLPKRMPVLNAIVSNNLINDGLGCLPPAPVSETITGMKSVAAVQMALFMEDPVAHTDLYIRKVARIFAEPWNDFRRAAVLPNALCIRFAHQALGALALAAIAASFAATVCAVSCLFQRINSKQSSQRDSTETFVDSGDHLAVMVFLALFGHLIYAAFEGIPRYGFTAVPLYLIAVFWTASKLIKARLYGWTAMNLLLPTLLLALLANFARLQSVLQVVGNPIAVCVLLSVFHIMLAAWLMYSLSKAACFQHINRSVMRTVCSLTLLLFGLTTTLCLVKESKNVDLITILSSEVMATREIDLSSNQASGTQKPSWALLLVDCEKEISQSHITFNGHKIHEAPKIVYHFYQKKFDLLAFLEELSLDIRVPVDEVRQWRAVPIPIEYVNPSGKNKVTISGSPAHPLTIYGDYEETLSGIAPTFEYISHSRMFTDASTLDWRPRVNFVTQVPSQSFIESNEPKYPFPPNDDLSSAPGVQKGRLRMMVALGFSKDQNSPAFNSQEVSTPLRSFNLRVATGQAQQGQIIDKSRQTGYIQFHSNAFLDVQINAQKSATHAVIELKGKADYKDAQGAQLVVRASLNGPDGASDKNANAEKDLYFDSKGQPKPQSVCFPHATQLIALNGKEPSNINIKAVYPLDVVSGSADHLTIELMPLPEGKEIKLQDAELTVRQLSWPDLGRGQAFVY